MAINQLKERKLLCASLYLLPFLALYVISVLAFQQLYLFKWLLDRWYLCVWAVAAILTYRQAHLTAISLTVGSILGVPLGQFCGDFVRNRNIQSITPLMSPEERARMYLHPGVPIWIVTVILFTLVGFLLEWYQRKTKRQEHDT